MWQDYILMGGSLAFVIALIPMLRDSMKGKFVNPFTAFMTALVLYIMGFTYITLGLQLTTMMSVLTASMWLIMGIKSVWR